MIKNHELPIQDGQLHIKNFPLKMVSLISKTLITIFWPEEMWLEIRKCIRICKALQSVSNAIISSGSGYISTLVFVRKCLYVIFKIDISVGQPEYSNLCIRLC